MEHDWSVVSNSVCFEKIPIRATPTSAKSRLSFTFINLRQFSAGPDFEKFCFEIIFIDHQTYQKPCWQFLSLQFAGVNFWMLSFNLVIDDWGPSCDVQQYSKFGYIIHHGLILHAKYHHTKFGHAVAKNIWNVDAQQRQRYCTWADWCYVMSVSNKFYLLVSIMLLSQDRAIMIFTVKFRINNIAFTILFWRSIQLRHGLNYTIWYIYIYICFMVCILDDIVA